MNQLVNRAGLSTPKRHLIVRVLRTLLFVLLTNPFALVLIPLYLGLLVHVIVGLATGHTDVSFWTWREVLGCAGFVAALATLLFLAGGHLSLSIIRDWEEE